MEAAGKLYDDLMDGTILVEDLEESQLLLESKCYKQKGNLWRTNALRNCGCIIYGYDSNTSSVH